jgi:hypothetical protein
MEGLDYCGTHECESTSEAILGFDYMALLKGAGGMLFGVAEGFGDKKAPAGESEALKRAQDEKKRAEQSATTMKWVLIGLAGLVGVGGIVLLATRPQKVA